MRVFFLFFIFLNFQNLFGQQALKISTQAYIELYKDIAIYEMKHYGIPASIKLSQGILESSSGNSELAQNANNHFGIKCKSTWKGKTYHKDDDAKDECFRKYDKVLDSYEDHSQFLKQNQRYAFLFDIETTDYKAWAHGLKKAGYATNPKYAELLIKTIEDNQLYRFDNPEVHKVQPVVQKNEKQKKSKDEEVLELTIKDKISRPIILFNGIKTIQANEGESPDNIAKAMDMMPWQIYKYNDLKKGDFFKAGETVYLQPKRNKGTAATHKVEQPERLRDIAQQYGIKLKRLAKLNNVSPDAQVSSGVVLKLK